MVEARDRGMSTTESIRIGTATTGRLITAAALVLAVVAGAFVFSDLVMMKYLAFGLLIALLLDATIVRMFLVPAIMKLLGDDCWWAPKWMKQLQNKIGLGETTLPDERRLAVPEPQGALVGAGAPVAPVPVPTSESSPRQPIAITTPVSTPAVDAPTTRFAAAKPKKDDRDIGSWLGELRAKTSRHAPEPEITSVSEDATTAMPTISNPTAAEQISAEETRAIPISRPEEADLATEQLNARGKHGGGLSAQELLRREGRL
jgi:hypothetical protein